jgi:hypothetical protein
MAEVLLLNRVVFVGVTKLFVAVTKLRCQGNLR